MYAKLCSFAYKYVNDEEVSRDIVHDLFVKIWKDQIFVRSGANLEAFLYTSVRNGCINYLRRLSTKNRKKEKVKAYYLDLSSESLCEHAILEKDTFKKVHDYIQELPAKSKKIMDLHLEGLTNEEIKDYLGISISTVKSLKRISYKKIRERFKKLT